MNLFAGFFTVVRDPRAANARHSLADILFVAFAAVLNGQETCSDFAEFGHDKLDVLREVTPLPNGIPSHDTFSRVFRLLDPVAFADAFALFTAAFAASLEPPASPGAPVIAIDGKSLRKSPDSDPDKVSSPLHLVTAWAAEQRLVLHQRAAPGRSETTAAREIISLLNLTGCIVTADALHGNSETAALIRKRGGDYALTIKGNRGPLHRAAKALTQARAPDGDAKTEETGHGRREVRRSWVVPVPGWAETYGFPGLVAIARIDADRTRGQKPTQTSSRFFALSCILDPAELLRVAREHWSIENRQHWLLDVVLREDDSATRNHATAQNLAVIRRCALNLLQADPEKIPLRRKTKRAGWNNDYLLKLLRQMR